MGYVDRVNTVNRGQSYVASADALIANDAEVSIVSATDTLLKTITRQSVIAPQCTLRISFDIARVSGGNTVFAHLTKNGRLIGVEQSQAFDAYATKSQDISFTDMSATDVIAVWGHQAAVQTGKLKNFRITGLASDWSIA